MDIKKIYNIDIELSYRKQIINFDEKIENYDEKIENYNEKIYKEEILKVFYLKNYDTKTIDNCQMIIFKDLVKNEKLKNIMKKLANYYFSEDLEFGFIILFSYDFFYIIHKCIQSYYLYGFIEDDFLNELEYNVKKFV